MHNFFFPNRRVDYLPLWESVRGLSSWRMQFFKVWHTDILHFCSCRVYPRWELYKSRNKDKCKAGLYRLVIRSVGEQRQWLAKTALLFFFAWTTQDPSWTRFNFFSGCSDLVLQSPGLCVDISNTWERSVRTWMLWSSCNTRQSLQEGTPCIEWKQDMSLKRKDKLFQWLFLYCCHRSCLSTCKTTQFA